MLRGRGNSSASNMSGTSEIIRVTDSDDDDEDDNQDDHKRFIDNLMQKKRRVNSNVQSN